MRVLKQIAGYLIIYRLAEGRGWTKDTHLEKMSTMDFNRPPIDKTPVTHLSTFRSMTPSGVMEEEGVSKELGSSTQATSSV